MQCISQKQMNEIYNKIRTPYKFGVIKTNVPDEENLYIDCPCVYSFNDEWYMSYVTHNPHDSLGGYRTHLSKSDNLLDWIYVGCIFDNSPDYPQCAAFPTLTKTDWNGKREIKSHNGKYIFSTMEGSVAGYEGEPMNIGCMCSGNFKNWEHSDKMLLTVNDTDAKENEKGTLYRSHIIEDNTKSTGHKYVMFYNAKESSMPKGVERIFMAVSDDMQKWRRYGDDCVLYADGNQITGDPQIIKIDDVWVMNLFIYSGGSSAYDTFAASKNLVDWQLWNGEPTVTASEEYDMRHAHKPWIVKHNDVVYHFYCARPQNMQSRGIALATSVDLKL